MFEGLKIYFQHSNIFISFLELFAQPGRVAVITGGNRGIGADVVEKLLQCEINVIMGEFQNLKLLFVQYVFEEVF